MLKKQLNNKGKFGLLMGNFDGVHQGHQFLIKSFIEECKLRKLLSVILTFTPHPRVVLSNVKNFLLTDYKSKIKLIESMGADLVIEFDFNRDFSSLSPKVFLQDYIKHDDLGLISVGHDFKFGANKAGTFDVIKEMSKSWGIECKIFDMFKINGQVPSSSSIRNFLLEGKIEDANFLLGRKFSVSGIVVKGAQRGMKIGFPTANIDFSKELLMPQSGVYVTQTTVSSLVYQSVTNIGKNPTFEDSNNIHLETHILDFARDIYGESIKVEIMKKIREERKFSSVNELVEQIEKDTIYVRKFFK